MREVDLLKAKLEVAKMATAAGSKRKRQDADVVPYSRESAKKGRKELEEKREVFLGGLVIEEVEVDQGDEGGEFLLSLISDGPLADVQ